MNTIRTQLGQRTTSILITILLAFGSLAISMSPAWAAVEALIGDRVYGPEDGLVVESGTVALGRTGQVTPLAETVFWRGTSYAATNHNTIFTYVGRSRAMANLYNGQRVIRVSFKYTRGGIDLIPWQHSDAIVDSSCTWSPGPEKTATVWDSLDPNSPVTEFHYSFWYADPRVC